MSQWESKSINRARLFTMNDIKRYAKGEIDLDAITSRVNSLIATVEEESVRLYKQEEAELDEYIQRIMPPPGFQGAWAG